MSDVKIDLAEYAEFIARQPGVPLPCDPMPRRDVELPPRWPEADTITALQQTVEIQREQIEELTDRAEALQAKLTSACLDALASEGQNAENYERALKAEEQVRQLQERLRAKQAGGDE